MPARHPPRRARAAVQSASLRVQTVLAHTGQRTRNGRLVEHQAAGELCVRSGVLVRGAAGVEKKLQRQWQAGVARQNGVDRGKCAARAVTAHSNALGVCSQIVGVGRQPGKRVPGVIRRRRKAVLGRQAVVERHHHAARQARQFPAQDVVRGAAADGETSAVQVQQHRQTRSARGCHQPRTERCAVPCGNGQHLHAL